MTTALRRTMNICKYIAAVCALICLIYSRLEPGGTMKFTDLPGEGLHNITVHTNEKGEQSYAVSDLTYDGLAQSPVADCVLTFNKQAPALWKDDTGKYTVTEADYDFVTGQGALGEGCAYFYKNDHRVLLATGKNLWLGSCNDMGSFTIELRFMPDSLQGEGVLFSRLGYFSGEKKGIEILIKGNALFITFYKVFEKDGSRRYDVHLNRGRPVIKAVAPSSHKLRPSLRQAGQAGQRPRGRSGFRHRRRRALQQCLHTLAGVSKP
jgi:hypothetical protein